MLSFYFASSLHLLLVFRFTVLCSLRHYLFHCASIDNRPNNLYLYYFIYTQLYNNLERYFLLMNALCNFIPYLYYSALISSGLYLFVSMCLCVSKQLYLGSYTVRIASLQGNHGYFSQS